MSFFQICTSLCCGFSLLLQTCCIFAVLQVFMDIGLRQINFPLHGLCRTFNTVFHYCNAFVWGAVIILLYFKIAFLYICSNDLGVSTILHVFMDRLRPLFPFGGFNTCSSDLISFELYDLNFILLGFWSSSP